MTFLILSLLALLAGPILSRFIGESRQFNGLVDAFVLVGIGGISLLHLLPEAFAEIGFMAFVLVGIGALLPLLLEHLFEEREKLAHLSVLVLALSGILLHTVLDGMALSPAARGHEQGEALAYAVVLHRIPVGLLVWWALRPLFKIRGIAIALGIMSLGSISGYVIGGIGDPFAHSIFPIAFQSLVTGSLLHVLFHRHFREESPGEHSRHTLGGDQSGAVVGSLAGLGLLILLPVESHLSPEHELSAVLDTGFKLFLKSAPALLLGFLVAAGLPLLLRPAGFSWLGRGSRAGHVTRGMIFGLPLPICSCGVVPLYHSLIRNGVPLGAAFAFLIATPELGVDAVLISVPLLGLPMTLLRLGAAALVAWGSGWLLDRFLPDAGKEAELTMEPETFPTKPERRWKQFWNTLQYELVDELMPWILLGILIAAITDPFLGDVDWQGIPFFLDVPLLALIGMPLYVCATGATPIAAVLLLNGVSPGGVLAFLLTGPATNLSTLGVIRNLNGTRAAILFPLTVMGITIVLGMLVNLGFGDLQSPVAGSAIAEQSGWIARVSATILVLLTTWSFLRLGPRGLLGNIHEGLGNLSDESHEHHAHGEHS